MLYIYIQIFFQVSHNMRILNPPVEYLVMFSEDLCPSGHGVRSFRSYYHQTSRKMDPKSLSSNLPIHPSHKLSICSALNPPPPPTPCTAQQRWSFGCRCFFPPRKRRFEVLDFQHAETQSFARLAHCFGCEEIQTVCAHHHLKLLAVGEWIPTIFSPNLFQPVFFWYQWEEILKKSWIISVKPGDHYDDFVLDGLLQKVTVDMVISRQARVNP